MKIFITPRSFSKTDKTPLNKLREAGCDCVINPYGRIMSKEEMIKHVEDADGVILGVDPMDKDVLSAAKNLKAIAKYGVGTDNIDLNYAKNKGINISVTTAANADAVADFAFALMMASARKLVLIDKMCHNKDWGKVITSDIYGKSLGVIGLGAIGKGMIKRASGFNMSIMGYDLYPDMPFLKENSAVLGSVQEICESCDFISLHIPLTTETRHIIGAKEIGIMKPTAVLINTARGGLVDEKALIKALTEQKIAGAGFDAFEQEPPIDENIYKLPNLIMGSHCAASTVGAAQAMSMMAAQNILSALF